MEKVCFSETLIATCLQVHTALQHRRPTSEVTWCSWIPVPAFLSYKLYNLHLPELKFDEWGCHISRYHLTFLHTFFVEYGRSWEVNSLSESQEIPRVLWNKKVYYRVYRSPLLVPTINHMNPVHTSHPISLSSILIIVPSAPRFFKLSLPFRLTDQNCAFISHLSHLPLSLPSQLY
jgi:hypothetical protein